MVCLTALRADWEISPFCGFQWNSTSDFFEGSLEFDHGADYGLFINRDIPLERTQFELQWTGSKLKAHWKPKPGLTGIPDSEDFDVYSNYWLLGFLKFFGSEELPFTPYISASVGAAFFSFDTDLSEEGQWFFSAAAGAGGKLFFTEKTGIRFGGRFLVPMALSGGGFSFSGVGSDMRPSGKVPVLQGDLYIGLIFRPQGKKG